MQEVNVLQKAIGMGITVRINVAITVHKQGLLNVMLLENVSKKLMAQRPEQMRNAVKTDSLVTNVMLSATITAYPILMGKCVIKMANAWHLVRNAAKTDSLVTNVISSATRTARPILTVKCVIKMANAWLGVHYTLVDPTVAYHVTLIVLEENVRES